MYFVVAGGGEVGYHLSKALLEAGHEVMIIERDRKRALWIEEQLGSVVINAPRTRAGSRSRPAASGPTRSSRSPATTRTT